MCDQQYIRFYSSKYETEFFSMFAGIYITLAKIVMLCYLMFIVFAA